MKRIILLAAVALIASVVTVQAQSTIKVDKAGIEKNIAKSDEDIQNAKKNTKAATWMQRGKVFTDAATAPTSGLYSGMDLTSAALLFGKGIETKKKVNEVEHKVMEFQNFDAYVDKNVVAFWDTKMIIYPGAREKALEAYEKAYSIDPKAKVKEALTMLVNVYKQDANNEYSLGKYSDAAASFKGAYDIQQHPTIQHNDTMSIFYAGYFYTLAHDFKNGLECLKIAKTYDYFSDGELHYFMFHCYYGLEDTENAKAILFEGLAKFPNNNKIVEGLLGLYSVAGGDGREIIPAVEKAIKNDPKNPELWNGLGRIYDKLKEYDQSVDAFEKAASLSPNDYGTNYNLGLVIMKRAEMMMEDMQKKNYTSRTDYNKDMEDVLVYFTKAIAPLEAAHKLNPEDVGALELLKAVCFRLREKDGIGEKYTKYNDLLSKLKGESAQ